MFGFIIIWCLMGLTSSLVAKNKGNDGCGGFILGFLLGPFGLFITLFSSTDYEEKNRRIGNTKKCKYCAEYVKEEAILCKHCGKEITDNIVDIEKENNVEIIHYPTTIQLGANTTHISDTSEDLHSNFNLIFWITISVIGILFLCLLFG